jgi:glycosyltransferase involved in cell wall biosynthesis
MQPEATEVTVLMPCLNEAETIARCIAKAKQGIEEAGVKGEVLVADNGSTDGSQAIATKLGARIIAVKEKGYGSALRGGIKEARGKWIIMGDADDSYDFSKVSAFVAKLREGADLVMGCRMPRGGGTIMPAAMPWKHRWIGNPVLTCIGRLFFRCPAQDFHCGLRGFRKESYERLDLQTTGMEFASEMVIKATMRRMRIEEVPITLYKDGRSRPPHLRSWRDGWRHLRFMLLFSPRWLFLLPGILLTTVGLGSTVLLTFKPVHLPSGIDFNVGTLTIASTLLVVGIQVIFIAFFTKTFAIAEGFLPEDKQFARWLAAFSLERGIVFGLALILLGLFGIGRALLIWNESGFGDLPFAENLRRLIPAATCIVIGAQVIFSSFFLSILQLKTARNVTTHPSPPTSDASPSLPH